MSRNNRKKKSRSRSPAKHVRKASMSPATKRRKTTKATSTRARDESVNKEDDRDYAMRLLKQDYEDMGQLIECACCYESCVFDTMAQCMEGHLVCVDCLNAFTKESVYGTGNVALGCMASDCASIYSKGELKRCLTTSTLKKLEERTLEENLNKAKVENLVRCPHCDFAAILSPRVKVFHCFKDDCQKDSCRKCGVDWAEHIGKSCQAVEKKDETLLCREYEEKMTSAIVRRCNICKSEFTKEGGCNLMTCRCGLTMCYICRTSGITHSHFCAHPLSPGKSCRECTACSLWTDPANDEKRAIKELKKEAQARRRILGYLDEKQIGAPETSRSKSKGK